MGITKARIIGVLMTAVLALSVPVVYADNGNGGNFRDGHWGKQCHYMKGKSCHKLNLTDDQKKQLKDIWQKQREAMKATFEQIKANREALTNELLQTTPDVNKINDLKSKMEALGAQMLDNRINSDLEVKKILTAEQFAKYLEFQKHKFAGRFYKGEWGHRGEGWGHWRQCRHHRHHHGNWGDQRDGGYGESHGYGNGDNE
jgi:Spy/CpxP family protein refolding chaperone